MTHITTTTVPGIVHLLIENMYDMNTNTMHICMYQCYAFRSTKGYLIKWNGSIKPKIHVEKAQRTLKL